MGATQFNSGFAPIWLRAKWGWFVALGVGLLALGIIAFGNLLAATVVSVFYIGVLMLIGAVAQIGHAFQVRNWGGFFFWLLSGQLAGAAGILAFSNPTLAAAALTLVLAISLIASGILRLMLGLRLRSLQAGWGWLAASGVITLLAGLVFALGWPANTLWLLGIVLAVDLTFQGITAIAYGLALKAER